MFYASLKDWHHMRTQGNNDFCFIYILLDFKVLVEFSALKDFFSFWWLCLTFLPPEFFQGKWGHFYLWLIQLITLLTNISHNILNLLCRFLCSISYPNLILAHVYFSYYYHNNITFHMSVTFLIFLNLFYILLNTSKKQNTRNKNSDFILLTESQDSPAWKNFKTIWDSKEFLFLFVLLSQTVSVIAIVLE